jgi:hypothetical protein
MRHCEAAGEEVAGDDTSGEDEVLPHWDLRVDGDGRLTAVLTGSEPPITVTGDSLANLRKQIKVVVLRGLL